MRPITATLRRIGRSSRTTAVKQCTLILNLTASKTFSFRVTSYTAAVEYMTNQYLPCVHVKFYRVD